MKEINVGFEFNGVKKIRVTDEEYNILMVEDDSNKEALKAIEQKFENELKKEGYDGSVIIFEIY